MRCYGWPKWRQHRYELLVPRRWPNRYRIFALIFVVLALETLYHVHKLQVSRQTHENEADFVFQSGCTFPDPEAVLANATIVMLARNSDIHGALKAITSLERHFNRWYRYPVTFLNNDPWSTDFIHMLRNATTGATTFEVIPSEMWSFPSWIDQTQARASIQQQNAAINAGEESYHHMCRFYSGMFYDVPALQKFRWFWRVEPDAEFTCSITYDPFVQMATQGKRYGYTIALWEVGKTAPGLFRLVDEYRRLHLQLRTTELWRAMIDAAWLPWPFRSMLSLLPHHTADGDYWNFCHYWSNFEIADMDFFRSTEYRKFFDFLDKSVGFYFQRFGDAPIHSFAAALFLQPHEIHHFEDIGYKHKDFWQQPNNALDLQKIAGNLTDDLSLAPEIPGASGCQCEDSEWKASLETTNVARTCSQRLGEAIGTK